MTWLTWRQHRWDAASALVLLLVLGAVVLRITIGGGGLLAGIARYCQANSRGFVPATCGSLPAQYATTFQLQWWWIVVAGTVIPIFVGMFVGAPMVSREVENGTHLLIWAQGITRRRWFLSGLGLLALGAVVGAALLSAVDQGWFDMQRSLGTAGPLSLWDGFEIGPPVVIAYTLFALALGAAAGAAIRRTVPAMAVTLVAFIAARVAVALLARPFYLPPLTARANFTASQLGTSFGPGLPDPSSDWLVGPNVLTDAAGHAIPDGGFCVGGSGCYSKVFGIQHYQPAYRFWLFQGIEAAIFVVLALVLFALAYRFVMRIR
jgi:hypothetical protein